MGTADYGHPLDKPCGPSALLNHGSGQEANIPTYNNDSNLQSASNEMKQPQLLEASEQLAAAHANFLRSQPPSSGPTSNVGRVSFGQAPVVGPASTGSLDGGEGPPQAISPPSSGVPQLPLTSLKERPTGSGFDAYTCDEAKWTESFNCIKAGRESVE